MSKIYSFDVFDTCIVRSSGNSKYVYSLLAKKILGECASMTQISDFEKLRIEGESKARKAILTGAIEEVTLDEIYRYCDFCTLTTTNKEEIKSAELSIEESLLFPNLKIKDEIKKLRESSYLIAFISDMYLPKSFISHVLKKYEIMNDGDKLYVSSDKKLTKASGNLYKLFMLDLNISAKQLVHTGDNNLSDYKVPKSLGIRANLCSYKYTYYENIVRKHFLPNCDTCKMAGISRAIRLSHEDTPYVLFASDFVAPIYVTFVYHILADAKQKGLTDIYFLARDGQIFYNIAKVFGSVFPEIGMHYLYVSRKSLYLPSLVNINKEGIKKRITSLEDARLIDILDRFQMNLEYEKFAKYESYHGNELLDTLMKDSSFVDSITVIRDLQRRLVLQYFAEQGLTSGNNAIVDLSGTRKCHDAINTILNSSGSKTVFGYYFDVLSDRLTGCDYEALYTEDYFKFNRLNIQKSPQLIFEQYFSIANHNSTVGYGISADGKVAPILDNSEVRDHTKQLIYDTNVSVCQEYAEQFKSLIFEPQNKYLNYFAMNSYSYFFYAPDPYVLKALDNMTIAETEVKNLKLFLNSNVFSIIRNKSSLWTFGDIMYHCRLKSIVLFFLRIIYSIRKHKKQNIIF